MVEDGRIRTYGGMGLLYWTGGKLGNCVIRVLYKMRDFDNNSGVFLRIPIEPSGRMDAVHYGYECKSTTTPKRPTRMSITSRVACTRSRNRWQNPANPGRVEPHGNLLGWS